MATSFPARSGAGALLVAGFVAGCLDPAFELSGASVARLALLEESRPGQPSTLRPFPAGAGLFDARPGRGLVVVDLGVPLDALWVPVGDVVAPQTLVEPTSRGARAFPPSARFFTLEGVALGGMPSTIAPQMLPGLDVVACYEAGGCVDVAGSTDPTLICTRPCAGVAIEPDPPAAPAPPEPPRLEALRSPCGVTQSARTATIPGATIIRCVPRVGPPFPSCGVAARATTLGACEPLRACGADPWPPGTDDAVFVEIGASGGDGSRDRPLGSLGEALRTRPSRVVFRGRSAESLVLDAPLRLQGTCPAEAVIASELRASRVVSLEGLTLLGRLHVETGGQVEARSVALARVVVGASASLVAEDVLLTAAGSERLLEAAVGARISLRRSELRGRGLHLATLRGARLVIEDTVARGMVQLEALAGSRVTMTDARVLEVDDLLAQVDGSTLTLTRVSVEGAIAGRGTPLVGLGGGVLRGTDVALDLAGGPLFLASGSTVALEQAALRSDVGDSAIVGRGGRLTLVRVDLLHTRLRGIDWGAGPISLDGVIIESRPWPRAESIELTGVRARLRGLWLRSTGQYALHTSGGALDLSDLVVEHRALGPPVETKATVAELSSGVLLDRPGHVALARVRIDGAAVGLQAHEVTALRAEDLELGPSDRRAPAHDLAPSNMPPSWANAHGILVFTDAASFARVSIHDRWQSGLVVLPRATGPRSPRVRIEDLSVVRLQSGADPVEPCSGNPNHGLSVGGSASVARVSLESISAHGLEFRWPPGEGVASRTATVADVKHRGVVCRGVGIRGLMEAKLSRLDFASVERAGEQIDISDRGLAIVRDARFDARGASSVVHVDQEARVELGRFVVDAAVLLLDFDRGTKWDPLLTPRRMVDGRVRRLSAAVIIPAGGCDADPSGVLLRVTLPPGLKPVEGCP